MNASFKKSKTLVVLQKNVDNFTEGIISPNMIVAVEGASENKLVNLRTESKHQTLNFLLTSAEMKRVCL